MSKPKLSAILACVAALAATTSAQAADLLSRDTLSGVVAVGAGVGSGERSWLDGGLGKARQGKGADALTTDAIIAWRPELGGRIGALVTADLQSDAVTPVGLDEAYLVLRPEPGARVRLSGRAGLFFPPASLEHDGSEWSVVRTLTPSAANSWIAEEVKVAGVEATARTRLAGRPVGLTVAAFQGNDTSGTLLAFRGWALHDIRATYNTALPLPPLPAMFLGKQAARTRPVDEVDGRWGVYGRADWSPAEGLDLNLFAYDNNGDRTTVTAGQYAWRTRFAQASARWAASTDVEVLAQAMIGETSMGKAMDWQWPADIAFQTAYILVARALPKGSVAGRVDYFAVGDRSFKALDNNGEHGWSTTLSWSRPLRDRLDVVTEGTAVRSARADRERFGLARARTDLQLRTALRASF